jgi:hypothetical protein
MTSGTRLPGYLPLTGGALTGNLSITTAGISALSVNSSSTNSASLVLNNTSAGGHNWAIGSSGAAGVGGAGYFTIYDNTAAATRLTIDTSGNLVMGGSGQFSGVNINGTDLLVYQASAGNLGVRAGTSGGGYKFFGFNSDGSFSISNGNLGVNQSITMGQGNSTETDLFMGRSGINKFYFSVGGTDGLGINRCNPSTGAYAETPMAIPQSGNIVFTRICQGPDFQATSDARLKSDIAPLRRGVEALKQMFPREYTIGGERRIGFLAQEVQ